MDKTILNILFNYKGTITYREFRVGITILFMLVGTYLSMRIITSISSIVVGQMGSKIWLLSSTIYNQITNSFIPNLVPVWFIVSYSSFMLAVKRIRLLNNSRTIAVISGIINYLFFASFIALIALEMYKDNISQEAIQVPTSSLIYMIYALFVIGFANLIYLCIWKKSEQICCSYPPKRLDVSGYALKLGTLMLMVTCASIVPYVILMSLNALNIDWYALYSSKIHAICILCGSLIILFFYIKYSIYRLKDTEISMLWLISVLLIYSVMVGLRIWINLYFQSNLMLYYNTVFAIATSFVVAAQYILFLLPSKEENKNSFEYGGRR